mgnify:CR=1 FL=1
MTIEAKNVTVSFDGRTVLDNVTFNISSDDTWVITGKEGSGKSTLIDVFLGLRKPDKGYVSLLGDYKYDRVNAGVVFQEDRLCEYFSAEENIVLVNNRYSEKRAGDELATLISREYLGIPVMKLPEDVKRCICIVRACCIPSDVLIMDEPFRKLSPKKRKEAIDYIKDAAGHKGIVYAQRTDEGLEAYKKFKL